MLADSDELKDCKKHGVYVDDGSGVCPMCIQSDSDGIENSEDDYPIELDDDEDDEDDE